MDKNRLAQILENENITVDELVEKSNSSRNKILAYVNHIPGEVFETWAGSGYLQHIIVDAINAIAHTNYTSAEVFGDELGQLHPLKLIIDQGTAPDEVVADILSDISILYRLQGGSGINFELEGVISMAL